MTALPTYAIVVGAGFLGYEIYNHRGELMGVVSGTPPKVPTVQQPAGANGATVNAGQMVTTGSKGLMSGSVPHLGAIAIGSGTGAGSQVDNAINAAKTALEQKAREEFDKLSCDAKKGGLEELKKKYPNLSLDPSKGCDYSWDDIAKAAGSVGGAAACTAIGLGATVAPICAIAGAYFGSKVEQWVEQFGNISVEDAGNALVNTLEKTGQNIIDEISSWWP